MQGITKETNQYPIETNLNDQHLSRHRIGRICHPYQHGTNMDANQRIRYANGVSSKRTNLNITTLVPTDNRGISI